MALSKTNRPRQRSIIYLLCTYLGLLLISVGGFMAASNQAHQHVRDLLPVIIIIGLLYYPLFIQVPRFKSTRLRAYRWGLLFIIPNLIVAFAWLDWMLSKINPANFHGLVTKWDALYFAVVTIATVGYGDIYPSSDSARIWITFQILTGAAFVIFILQREIRSRSEREK